MTQHRKQTEPAKSQNGFTLVELLVAMFIGSLLLAAAFTLFASYTRTNTIQTVSTEIQQDIRAGISFMELDIRSAGLNPRALTTGVGFTAASSTSFTFTSDNDFNGLVAQDDLSTAGIDETQTSPDERIIYTLNIAAGTLTRQNLLAGTPGTQTILNNVANPSSFTYRGINDSVIAGDPIPAANLTDIRSVIINLTLSEWAGTRFEKAGKYGTISRTIQTRVYCRNLNL